MSLYRSLAEFDDTGWRWPHFSPEELNCKCGTYCRGAYFHDPAFLDALELMRLQIGPLQITSAHRCPRHNRAVGGVPNSQHTIAIAADIALAGHGRRDLAYAAMAGGFKGLGYGKTFLHVDLGPRRAWTYPGAYRLWVAALGFDPLSKGPKKSPARRRTPVRDTEI